MWMERNREMESVNWAYWLRPCRKWTVPLLISLGTGRAVTRREQAGHVP